MPSVEDQPVTAASIRHQMDTIRASLGSDMEGLKSDAEQLTDWRYYVRTFPWASLGAAVALGYLVIPRRLEIISPDEKVLEQLAKHNRLVVEHRPKGEDRRSLLGSMASMTGNMLLRAGIAYASQQLGKVAGQQAASETPQQSFEETQPS